MESIRSLKEEEQEAEQARDDRWRNEQVEAELENLKLEEGGLRERREGGIPKVVGFGSKLTPDIASSKKLQG